MEATVVYNGNAGSATRCTVDEIQGVLRSCGFDPVYRATACEDDLDPILEDSSGLIVAAGGDGTLRAVMRRVVDRRSDQPLCLLPMGTANNVARQLGLNGGDPLDVVAGLSAPRKVPFDVGRVRMPHRVDYFLEGAGLGFFAESLHRYQPEEGKSVLRAVRAFVDTLSEYPAHEVQMRVDGEELEGRYLLVAAMNTAFMGPGLQLAPEAASRDGLLDLVLIPEASRLSFARFLAASLLGGLDEHPEVEILRASRVEMGWGGFPLHSDAEVHLLPEGLVDPPEFEGRPGLTFEVVPHALEIWLPS